jgi:hypothetical protein
MLLSSAVRADSPKIVKVGIYQNPPKCFVDQQGNSTGIFIDFIRAVAQDEGWELEFVPGSWKEGLDRLLSSEIDIMPDVAYAKSREELYAFNAEPVLSDWFQIFARADLEISSILDLDNRRVTVLVNSVQHDSFLHMIKDSDLNCEIIHLPDYESAFAMVNDGRADAVIVNRYYGMMKSREYTKVKETGIIFHPTRLHFAAPKTGRSELLETIDKHLRLWKEDDSSVYYRSLKKWTGEAPSVALPKYLKYAALFLTAALVLALAFAGLLKWRVQVRTSELRTRTDELQKALVELRSANEKAQQQERLYVLGQMASGIAHDFNNILWPIIGFSELILNKPEILEDRQKVKRYLETIREAGQDGVAMVERMRTFYRIQQNEKEFIPVDLCDVVRNTVELTRPKWETERRAKGCRVNIQTDLKPVPMIPGDPAQLREVLVNLIFNSFDAMPQGGVIRIAVQETDGKIRVLVTDEGEGMSGEVLANCLHPFYTTKGKDGTGMGLAMAVDIIEKHKGKMEIRSQPGKGTEITLLFDPMIIPADKTTD